MIKILINADDYGLSDGICRGILELFELGAISNTTVMIAAEGGVERVKRWGVHRIRGRAGVHLQVTNGNPLSSHESAPSLVRTDGTFIPRSDLNRARTEDVYAEWKRQIEQFCEVFGELPSHFDSHHGAHHLANCTPAYFSLAAEYGVPVRGGANELETVERGIRGSDIVVYDWTTRNTGGPDLARQISEAAAILSPGQNSVEVVTHPGYNDAYLPNVSSLNEAREFDLEGLREFADSHWISNSDYTLSHYPTMS